MSQTLRASRTAVLVCQGRAAADGRIAPGRFADPTAMPLLRPTSVRPSGGSATVLRPDSGRSLLARHGYTVTQDDSLLETAAALAIPIRHRRSLRHSRVMVADRT